LCAGSRATGGRKKIKRILFIYWCPFGDTIALTPLIEVLSKAFPGGRLTYIAGRAYVKSFDPGGKTLERNPYIDRIIFSDINLIRKLCLGDHYDIVIDLYDSKFTSVLRYLSAARDQVWSKFRMAPSHFFITRGDHRGFRRETPRKIKFRKGVCRVDCLLDIARALKIGVKKRPVPKIYLDNKERDYGRKALLKLRANRRWVVGLHPGNQDLERRWPVKDHAVLADRLIEELGCTVLIFYGPREEACAGMVCRLARNKLQKVFRPDIREYMALISGLDLFISADGGPLHMALALGVPNIGLFTNRRVKQYWYQPYGRKLCATFFGKAFSRTRERVIELVFQRAKRILTDAKNRI
jgi:ADP-heptose:LPS heptosyltransferase